MRSKLITPSTSHRSINGAELCKAREEIGLSQAAFASECGYSQQYQQQIEAPGLHEIKTAKAEQILAVLEKYK